MAWHCFGFRFLADVKETRHLNGVIGIKELKRMLSFVQNKLKNVEQKCLNFRQIWREKNHSHSVCASCRTIEAIWTPKTKKFRKQLNHMQYYLFVESVSQRVDHVTNAHLWQSMCLFETNRQLFNVRAHTHCERNVCSATSIKWCDKGKRTKATSYERI